jgi:hypothetical protein
VEQQLDNEALHKRRLRIEHVNSSVKCCRIVKDWLRLRKKGIRDRVMELCCALHRFRVRLSPWRSMIESGYTPFLSKRTDRGGCSSGLKVTSDIIVADQRPQDAVI